MGKNVSLQKVKPAWLLCANTNIANTILTQDA